MAAVTDAPTGTAGESPSSSSSVSSSVRLVVSRVRAGWGRVAPGVTVAGRGVWYFAAWSVAVWPWVVLVVTMAGSVAARTGDSGDAWTRVVVWWVLPGVGFAVWRLLRPAGFERWCAAPARRARWQFWTRVRWNDLTEHAGWTDQRPGKKVRNEDGTTRPGDPVTVRPRLRRVRTGPSVVTLDVHARPGQTLADLEEGVPRLAATVQAMSHRAYPVVGKASRLRVELVMREHLLTPTRATLPLPASGPALDALARGVVLGRSHTGEPLRLPLLGRHSLIVGASGSGKGSVLWGIVGGLAPYVPSDVVRLHGIDLKRGVELAMGEALFTTRAYDTAAALEALRAMVKVIDERGPRMAGRTRLHEPRPGDPLHVLVVDELAALTAYAPYEVRRDAETLLSLVLSQGRALGVIVVAAVQDPRKDVVTVRGLFTQTLALRLRGRYENDMVLGEGYDEVAPAHRISPAHPGTGYVVEDTGAVARFRAHHWSDRLVRATAAAYATTVHAPVTTTATIHPTTGRTVTATVVPTPTPTPAPAPAPAAGGGVASDAEKAAFLALLHETTGGAAGAPQRKRSPRTTTRALPTTTPAPGAGQDGTHDVGADAA